MYPEVRAEMARKKISLDTIANGLECTVSTASLKLNGKSPITLREAVKIKSIVGSELPIEELFKTEARK
jgi:hypothetical protein